MKKKISPTFLWSKTLFSALPIVLPPLITFLYFVFFVEDDSGIVPESFFLIMLGIGRLIVKYIIIPFLLINIPRCLLYKKTIFEFKDKAMLYQRDFISLSQKTVKYPDIKEVTLHRTPLQKMFGLGTVKIVTHATTADAGVELFNIKEYQEVYEFLMKQVRD